ncbi:MAG: response regulator, partial [Syntrophales bacterium]
DTILLVDDEPHVLSALTRSLRNTGYEVLTAAGGIQALEIMGTTKIKVIVSDEQMIGMQGSELLAAVQKRFPHTLRILLTGKATLETAMQAVNNGGIYRFLTKPWDDALLRFALSAAIEKFNSEAERRRLQEELQRLHNDLEHRVAERTEELRDTNETLTAKSRELEQTNTALHVLLRNREEELRQTEQKIVANLQKLVLPYIAELKELGLSPGQANHVEIIDTNLQQVIDPFLQNLAARFSAFTPREIQIANLIKDGKTSKEIATLVKVAPHSVEFHRNNIRKKLGLGGKKTNLHSFLLTLS